MMDFVSPYSGVDLLWAGVTAMAALVFIILLLEYGGGLFPIKD